MILSESQWRQTWEEVTDSLPLPAVNLGDSILILVASEEYGSGPNSIEIEDVRMCAGTPEVIVMLREHTRGHQHDYGDRSLRAVTLARDAIAGRVVRFVDLSTVVQ